VWVKGGPAEADNFMQKNLLIK
jgi:hypothetical protein